MNLEEYVDSNFNVGKSGNILDISAKIQRKALTSLLNLRKTGELVTKLEETEYLLRHNTELFKQWLAQEATSE